MSPPHALNNRAVLVQAHIHTPQRTINIALHIAQQPTTAVHTLHNTTLLKRSLQLAVLCKQTNKLINVRITAHVLLSMHLLRTHSHARLARFAPVQRTQRSRLTLHTLRALTGNTSNLNIAASSPVNALELAATTPQLQRVPAESPHC